MRITDVRVSHYRIPLERPSTDSTHGEMTHFEVVMVHLEAHTGAEGTGYTYTIGQGGRAIRSLIEDDIAPLLLGENGLEIEKLWDRMWWRLHYVGLGGLVSFAISAVDVALWDLKCRAYEVPLWRELGGYSSRVAAYSGGIDLQLSTEQLLDQARKNLDAGFRAIKMKVGRQDLREDIERVKAMRDFLGDGIPLMVDANMRWDVQTAIRASRALREFQVYWLEEPIIPDDTKGHRRIAVEGGLPLATGENLHTIYEFRQILEHGSIAFPEPDCSNLGGITGWLRVARLAYAHNLPVTTHGVHELHLHLLASIPNASFLEVHGFGLERFETTAPELQDGYMLASEKPGHGVEFDWEALRPYACGA